MTYASGQTVEAARIRQARAAVSAAFFIFGLMLGIWAVHIPIVAGRLHLDPAVLGLGLLNVGFGGVISQPISGWLTARSGSRLLSAILVPLMIGAFLFPIFSWNTPLFFVATLTVGLVVGSCNVAVNTQASEIERARGRPTMSSFHGFFSLGALAGASLGGGIIAVGRQDGSGAASVAAVMIILALVAARYYLPAAPAPRPPKGGRRFSLPNSQVLGLAGLSFFANMTEGAVNDWSALYLTTVRAIDPALAVSGFALFSLAMAICRLGGGPVVARFGERSIVVFGGVLMALGMGIVVFSPWNAVSPFGFALVAVGAANTIPVMISAAARASGSAPSAGVAAASTGAILGFLIGPPVLGFIAHATSLSVSLGLLSLVGVVIAIGAALFRWPPSQISQQPLRR